MGFVDGWSPMGMRRQLAGAVRHRPRRRARGSRYQLVEGIALLSKVDWQAQGPRRTSAGPTASTSARSTAGRAFLERIKGRELPGIDVGRGVAARAPPDRLHPRAHARRLPVRQRDVPTRRAGAARRDRRLGDGHRRRSEARPRLGRPELARGHHGTRRPSESSYVDMRGMPSRDQVLAHYARCRAGRSTTSTTT